MADVTDRGQIIVVTGLLIAVALVALALMLNTVIFTENLASRGSDIGGRDALEFRQTVSDHVARLLAEENGNDYTTNGSVRENVTDGVGKIESILRTSYAHRSVVTEIANLTLHNGSRLQQTDESVMTSASGAVNWTLATGISENRTFVVNITDDTALNETDDPANELDQVFRITVEDASDTWNLYVYRNSSGATDTEIAVENATGPVSIDVCSSSVSATPRIDLLNGTVDGSSCSALQFAKGVSAPYDVTYTWGNRSAGNYTLTVNVSGSGSTPSSNFNDPTSSPFEAHIVYSADLDLIYQTSRLRYQQGLHVVPEGSS